MSKHFVSHVSRGALWSCFIVAAALVEPARAETVKISGLSFAVDSLSDVDASTVKVSVFGETQIVARVNLDDYIAQRYFSNPQAASSFPFAALRGFVLESLNQGMAVRAAEALGALCIGNPEKSSEIGDFLASLSNSDHSRAFFQAAAGGLEEKRCGGAAAAAVVLRAGLSDLEWLKTKGVRLTFDYAGDLRVLAEREFQKAGGQRNFPEMNRYLQFYGAAFGSEDTRYLELKVLYAKVSQAAEALQRGEIETAYPLMEQSKSDAALSDILGPLFVESLHLQAAKALARNDPQAALSILSHFDLRRRTPTTHQLIQKALQELQPSDHPPTADPATATLLRTVAMADVEVRAQYLMYLDRLLNFFIAHGSFDEINPYFEALIALRPDPSVENDRIRVQQISAYLDKKMLYSARDKLQYIQTGVPLFSKIGFAFRGLYFDPMYIVIAIVSPIAAGIVIYLVELLARLRRRVTNVLRKKARAQVQEEEEIQPAFVKSGLARAMSPSMIEYRECLKVFGLSGDVDLKTIKAAYRNAVKAVHPDLHKDLDRQSSERFLLLTTTYERLLELHEQVQIPKLTSTIE